MSEILLVIGGILNIALAVFHFTFWKNPLFNWKEELPKLNLFNRALLQVATILFIYVMLCFAVISFLISSSKTFGSTEKAMVIFIGGFYLLRAILQFPFFGVSKLGVGIFIICLLISGCYFASFL
ncbi:MAG: hypothetical protein AB1630_02515 [bacterium]